MPALINNLQVNEGLIIRDYRREDNEAVRCLHIEAMTATGAHHPGPWDRDFECIAEVYAGTGGAFIVGELGGAIIAMGAFRPVGESTVELKRMRVLPGVQRRGIGSVILVELERRAGESGFHSAILDTTIQQRAAIAFYEAHGYSIVDSRIEPHAELVVLRKSFNETPRGA